MAHLIGYFRRDVGPVDESMPGAVFVVEEVGEDGLIQDDRIEEVVGIGRGKGMIHHGAPQISDEQILFQVSVEIARGERHPVAAHVGPSLV